MYNWLKLMSENKTISFAEKDFRVFQKCFMQLMSEDKELRNILMATLARAVARKARSVAVDQGVKQLEKYASLLQTFTQDGVLGPLEKHTLRTYRKRHGITHDNHVTSLQQI